MLALSKFPRGRVPKLGDKRAGCLLSLQDRRLPRWYIVFSRDELMLNTLKQVLYPLLHPSNNTSSLPYRLSCIHNIILTQVARINPPFISISYAQDILNQYRAHQLARKVRSWAFCREAARTIVVVLRERNVANVIISAVVARVPNTPACRRNDFAQIGLLECYSRKGLPRSAEVVETSHGIDGGVHPVDSAVVDHIPTGVVGIAAGRCDAALVDGEYVYLVKPRLCGLSKDKIYSAEDQGLGVELRAS